MQAWKNGCKNDDDDDDDEFAVTACFDGEGRPDWLDDVICLICRASSISITERLS